MFCFEQKITKSRWDFRHQRQKQSQLGNLMRADISRFVSFATFCEKCFYKIATRPAVAPYLTVLRRQRTSLRSAALPG
jgi:hypothetical protein